jgi:PAS domain S-box-containing protein/diguanylate cyclase (GGDEF)-like protein
MSRHARGLACGKPSSFTWCEVLENDVNGFIVELEPAADVEREPALSQETLAEYRDSETGGVVAAPGDVRFLGAVAISLLESTALAVLYVNAEMRCRHVGAGFARLVGWDPGDLVGHLLAEVGHPCAIAVLDSVSRAAQSGDTATIECALEGPDGSVARLLAGQVVPHPGREGTVDGYLAVVHDISEAARVTDFLARRDPFIMALLDAAVDGVIVTDCTGVVRAMNRTSCRLFGYSENELLGQNITQLMPPPYSRDHGRYMKSYLDTGRAKIIGIGRESLGKRKDGTVFPVHISVGEARVGDEVIFVGIIRDISDRVEAEQRASYLARHDPLTGVLTRSAFLEECAHVLTTAETHQEGACFVLYSLDVDQFSDINEAFGFHIGDAALKALVSRVIEVLPKESIICRISADEFAALVQVEHLADARTLATQLHDRLTASVYADRYWVRLRVSIGAAEFNQSVRRIEELNAKAKLALQAVQHNGGNAVCFYTPEMAAAATRRMLLTMHLAHAIECNELHLVYQPIVDAKTARVVSAEALLRWSHQTLGAISPGEFIPVAEESGLIVPITDWVVASVVQQMVTWESQGVLPNRVFINISGQQFLRGNLTQRMTEILTAYPFLYNRLGLEITEQAAVRDLKVAVRTIGELAAIGVHSAIDDFGSGYSSLSYVQQLPVSELKIDRAFVIDIPDNIKNAALVRAAVGMAHGLGLTTVAEGVETPEQQDFLVSVGCDLLQGYLFGYPMSPDALVELIRSSG